MTSIIIQSFIKIIKKKKNIQEIITKKRPDTSSPTSNHHDHQLLPFKQILNFQNRFRIFN